jgi:hypothetical protein
MKLIKKVAPFLLFLFLYLRADYVQWNSSGTYTIPDDTNYYYLDESKTLTGDLTIKGDDTVFTYSSSQESTIASNALIRVQDATFRVVQ